MAKKTAELFALCFDNPSHVYAPGQTLSGFVDLHLNNNTTVNEIQLQISGKGVVRWIEGRIIYVGEEHYMNVTVPLVGSGNKLEAGKYRYPFAMDLPVNIPSSYPSQIDKKAVKALGGPEYTYIRYKAKATLDRPWKMKLVNTQLFIVLSIIDLNTLPLSARVPCEVSTSESQVKDTGIEATLRLNKTCFVRGERLLADINIVNNSKYDTVVMELKLIQIVTATVRQGLGLLGNSSEVVNVMTSRQLKVERPANRSVNSSIVHVESMFVPPTSPPSWLGGVSRILDVNYKLKLFLKTKWIVITIAVDITIGTVPLIVPLVPQQQQYQVPRFDLMNTESASNFHSVTSPQCSGGPVSFSEADFTSREVAATGVYHHHQQLQQQQLCDTDSKPSCNNVQPQIDETPI